MSQTIALPREAGPASRLFLLFHGVGATAQSMLPLGRLVAGEFPDAAVVCVASPYPADFGGGAQWFSVSGITEENRPARVAQAMPTFRGTIGRWQSEYGVPAGSTTLIGFSQGAIMALESTTLPTPQASRVVSLSGRFASLPDHAAEHTTIHLIHGRKDGVIPHDFAVAAGERLRQLGSDVTVDVLPQVGHEINAAVAAVLLRRLHEQPSTRGAQAATGDHSADAFAAR